MSIEYKWNTPKKSKIVIESAADQALLQKKIMFPMTLSYRNINDKESEFRLVYDPIGTTKLKFSYTPPGLKGHVKSTSKGCEITAVPYSRRAVMCNIANIMLIVFLFTAGIGSLFYDAGLPVATSIICLAMGFGFAWSFYYTYTKYRNLNRHLEIMNNATGVDYIT
ncbi:MAG: hypothetical protein FWE29_03175 [Defluviitaleaceae bacterium]|nr:hypothetical protein [Defluviitaleaceae bacterium]